MTQAFNNYRPCNYSHEEITQVLENGKKVGYILRNLHKLSNKDIAKNLNVSEITVRRLRGTGAGKKPKVVKFRDHQETTPVFNTETGIYYESISKAAGAAGIKRQTMRDYVQGCRKNNVFKQWVKV